MASKLNMPDIYCCDICGKPFLSEEKLNKHEEDGIELPNISLGDDIAISVNNTTDVKAKIIQAKMSLPITWQNLHKGLIIEFLAETSDGTRIWVKNYKVYSRKPFLLLPSWAVYLQTIHENLKTSPENNLRILEEMLSLPRKTKEKMLKLFEEKF